MPEIDSNVSLKGATRASRVALHAKNLGEFVRSGASVAPSSKPKVSTVFSATVKVKQEGKEQPPLALDPLFRRFKGDSKAARIKDTGKRAGNEKSKLNKPGTRAKRHAELMAQQSKTRVHPLDREPMVIEA